jgi:hypothetical protein
MVRIVPKLKAADENNMPSKWGEQHFPCF